MSQQDALQVPEAAIQDAKSFELLRLWVASQDQHVSLRVGVWKDPAAWGVVLADLARHVANAYAQNASMDRDDVLERVQAAFERYHLTFLKRWAREDAVHAAQIAEGTQDPARRRTAARPGPAT